MTQEMKMYMIVKPFGKENEEDINTLMCDGWRLFTFFLDGEAGYYIVVLVRDKP